MATKSKFGYNISECERCGETHFPVSLFKENDANQYLCDRCKRVRKLEKHSKKYTKQCESDEDNFNELISLP